MTHRLWVLLALSLLVAAYGAPAARAQTVNGNSLALKSSGSASGNDWVLNGTNTNTQAGGYGNGYVGTYITLASPGSVTLQVNASGATGDGTAPHMNIVMDDSITGYNVTGGFNNYSTTLNNVPAGTHFVRVELNNDTPTTSRTLTVRNLQVSGATSVANQTDVPTLNANALAAANQYIANYRKGPATIKIQGVPLGTPVQVDLVNHKFMFGTAVSGTDAASGYLDEVNPSPASTAGKYQAFLNSHFNAIVPENAGKWPSNEWTRDSVTMSYLNQVINYAKDPDRNPATTYKLRMRMHNMLWGGSGTQPTWVENMLNNPDAIDPVSGKTNRNALRDEITERVGYYITGHTSDYLQLDVINESAHSPTYTNVYGGISGMANIHNEVAAAAAGGTAKLYTNEFNVFQWSTDPAFPGPFPPYPPADEYANWYRQHVEAIKNAGGQVDGIGVQYYVDNSAANAQLYSPHSTNRMMKALQNLAVEGLPLSLTEFGVGSQDVTPTQAADFLDDSMRMAFGMPGVDTFMMWGFWQGAIYTPASALVDNSWNLTEAGKKWEDLLGIHDWDGNPNNAWDTLVNTNVAAGRQINFNGFYGDYVVTINGQQYPLSLVKGTNNYTIVVNPSTGDLNDDGNVDDKDIDILWNVIRPEVAGSQDPGNNDNEDLNGDGFVNEHDVDYMLANLLDAGSNRQYGDADLDGGVGGLDYSAWRLRAGTGWANGDFDGDGGVGGLDYTLWRTRPTAYPGTVGPHGLVGVPEPSTWALALIGLAALASRTLRRSPAAAESQSPVPAPRRR